MLGSSEVYEKRRNLFITKFMKSVCENPLSVCVCVGGGVGGYRGDCTRQIVPIPPGFAQPVEWYMYIHTSFPQFVRFSQVNFS